MKGSVCVFLASILVAGCSTDTQLLVRKASSGASIVTIGQEKLGDYWCLADVSETPDGTRSVRAQIREVALDAWDAHETRLQNGEYLSCDAGSFEFRSGGACAGSPEDNPATDVLVNGTRIAIKRDGMTKNFNVTFKDPSGTEYAAIAAGSFEAVGNEQNDRYRWLTGSVDVSGPGGKVAYDVYIYLNDHAGTTQRLAKYYRVEFFRRTSGDCIAEEPINSSILSGPYTPGTKCDGRSPIVNKQAPIGDGHHGNAVGGKCTY